MSAALDWVKHRANEVPPTLVWTAKTVHGTYKVIRTMDGVLGDDGKRHATVVCRLPDGAMHRCGDLRDAKHRCQRHYAQAVKAWRKHIKAMP